MWPLWYNILKGRVVWLFYHFTQSSVFPYFTWTRLPWLLSKRKTICNMTFNSREHRRDNDYNDRHFTENNNQSHQTICDTCNYWNKSPISNKKNYRLIFWFYDPSNASFEAFSLGMIISALLFRPAYLLHFEMYFFFEICFFAWNFEYTNETGFV